MLFAPLYISNLCNNDCLYCAFRVRNKELQRRALTQEEIRHEVEVLVDQGHKRILLVAGESYPKDGGFQYVLDSIATIYDVKRGNGEIRRVNVNVAPLPVDQFRELKASGIGTFQLFQETYHRETYRAVHVGGKKKDFDWRVTGMHRAMEAGIDDVGIGVLFGLADWRYEILAMLQHIHELERAYGVGPHTISVPRLEPASGSDMASHPPQPVSDVDFRKIVAILRLAVPYTGMILSTRETANLRQETFALGISQISAGSRTNPGGYEEDEEFDAAQFQLGDHRSLDEVIRDISELGFVPSFCTACYRLGPHRHGLHGPRQAGRHQAPLRPQRAEHVRGVPARLRQRGDPRRRRGAHRRARSRRWTRCAAPTPRRCSRRCAPAIATCSAERAAAPHQDPSPPHEGNHRERRRTSSSASTSPTGSRTPVRRPEGLHRVRLQHQDAHRPARRQTRTCARRAASCSSSSSARRPRPIDDGRS